MNSPIEYREMVSAGDFLQLAVEAAPAGNEHPPKRLLVVEDQAALREILHEVLCREGYAVDTAGSLLEARCALMLHSYDVALLDVMLPDGDAYQLLRAVRSDPSCSNTRIVLLSALNQIDDYMQGYASGADDYVGKPFDFEDLVCRLKRLC